MFWFLGIRVGPQSYDAELDRLKAAQDLAFQRKQRAYDAQDAAWKRRTGAGDAMNHAYEEKQRAYTEQDSTWQNLQRVRDNNGPRIDRLNAQQEAAFESMKRAYDSASAAYDRRDGASAKSYAEEGRRHKEEAQCYVQERRRLVDEIRTAKARLDAIKPTFQRAKADFDSAKCSFDSAKADHSRAQDEFKRAKADFDQAAKAFKARLEIVRAESSRKKSDKHALAAKAGVPYGYRDKVWVSTDSDGNTNIYFGGAGQPNGPGHGHYVLDQNGTVTYKRDPFDPHGTQNFTDTDSRGSTLYDSRMRSGSRPAGAEGIFARRDGGREHSTQYYADGYRYSSDTDGSTNTNQHWTNQNVGKKSTDRHTPPSDAKN